MADLAAYALAVLLSLAPPERAHPPPGWEETPDAMRARYASIAADVAAVAETSCAERPASCSRWALRVLLGISFHESRWDPDVDAGRCYRGRGWERRCDGGASVSIFQIRAGGEEGRLYASDRQAAAREALQRAVRSWNGCRAYEPALRFGIYAGGSCTDPTAQKRSRELWASIERVDAVRVP